MKYWIYAVLLLLASCEKKESCNRDFDSLMGKNLSYGEFIETADDQARYDRFKKQYEKLSDTHPTEKRIPFTLHLIWLGEKKYPKEHLYSWINKHSSWRIKLWTDRIRKRLPKKIEQQLIDDFSFSQLRKCFSDTLNLAEREELLRFEILFQEGGVVIGSDVSCNVCLDDLNKTYDFYTCLAPPHNPVIQTSISPSSCILGSCLGHPILQKTMQNILNNWKPVSNQFLGDNKEAVIYRSAYRTLSSFNDALYDTLTPEAMVFPAGYFHKLDKENPIYGERHYESTWVKGMETFEEKFQERLENLKKRTSILFWSNSAFCGVAFLGLFALRKRNRFS